MHGHVELVPYRIYFDEIQGDRKVTHQTLVAYGVPYKVGDVVSFYDNSKPEIYLYDKPAEHYRIVDVEYAILRNLPKKDGQLAPDPYIFFTMEKYIPSLRSVVNENV